MRGVQALQYGIWRHCQAHGVVAKRLCSQAACRADARGHALRLGQPPVSTRHKLNISNFRFPKWASLGLVP